MPMRVGLNLPENADRPTACLHSGARETDEGLSRQREVPSKEQFGRVHGNNNGWLHPEDNGVGLSSCPFGATRMNSGLDGESGSNGRTTITSSGSAIFPLNPSSMLFNMSSGGGDHGFPGVSVQVMDVPSLNALLWTIQRQQQYQMQLLGQLQQQLFSSGGFGLGASSMKAAAHRYPAKRNELDSGGIQTQPLRCSFVSGMSPDSVELRRLEANGTPPAAECGGVEVETPGGKVDGVMCKTEPEKDVLSPEFSHQGESSIRGDKIIDVKKTLTPRTK